MNPETKRTASLSDEVCSKRGEQAGMGRKEWRGKSGTGRIDPDTVVKAGFALTLQFIIL